MTGKALLVNPKTRFRVVVKVNDDNKLLEQSKARLRPNLGTAKIS